MKKAIKWKIKKVRVGDIKRNPDNPKKRDQEGYNRLQKSMDKFGVVFDGIINQDYRLIDGHSRLEERDDEELVNVFFPSRMLTDHEYNEMNAVFDFAKAGEIDTEIILSKLGEAFFDDWVESLRVEDIETPETPHVEPIEKHKRQHPVTCPNCGNTFDLND